MNRQYHKWFSPRIGRDVELLVFGHAGARVMVFPARMGRFYDYEDWGLVDALRPQLDSGWVQLFCVDSIDRESLYGEYGPPADRIARHGHFEDYVLSEVMPFSESINRNPFAIAHGCSLGAYHALNIALRHPERFGKVVALSGRFDLARTIGPYRDLFQGYYDDSIYFHNPSHYLPNLADDRILGAIRRIEITLAVGQDDPVADDNRHISRTLWDKGAWHHLHLWPGEAHKPRYWRHMVSHYL